MSSVTPTGVMDLWPERSCPSCNTNVLRRGERHEQCFDCLGHGPITMEDLRCDICRAWRPTHFLGATAKYVEGSQARLDAVKLAECEKTPQRLAPEVSLPPTCSPANIGPVVTQPLGVTQETLTSSSLSVLAGLGFPVPVQGPQVPGLCSLVGQGVPAGSVPPLSAPQSVEGPSAPKKRRVSKKTLSSGRAKKDGSVPAAPVPVSSEPVVAGRSGTSRAVSSRKRKGQTAPSFDLPHPDGDDHSSLFDGGSCAQPAPIVAGCDLGSVQDRSGSYEEADGSFRSEGVERKCYPSVGGRFSDRSFDRESAQADLGGDRYRSPLDRQSGMGVVPQGHSSPAPPPVSRRTAALGKQAAPSPSAGDDRSFDRSFRGAIAQSDCTGEPSDDQPSLSDDDDQAGQVEVSTLRWALETIASRRGLPIATPAPPRGFGRFATAQQRVNIQLPVAPPLASMFERINKGVTSKKDVSRQEAQFPSWRASTVSANTYRSSIDGKFQTAVPEDEPHLGLLSRKPNVVWAAYIKKARLLAWQSMVHQMMGQLSLTDHLVTLAQEFVDTADMAGEDRQRLNSTLDVVSKVIGVSERTSVILGAHLDLTVREAELRMLDLTLVDEADMRARPLFEGHTFGLLSKSDVQAMGQSRRDEILVKAVASKATSGPKQSKAKAKTAKSTAA